MFYVLDNGWKVSYLDISSSKIIGSVTVEVVIIVVAIIVVIVVVVVTAHHPITLSFNPIIRGNFKLSCVDQA